MTRPQIADKIVERILRIVAEGAWPADEPLPSVRQMAGQFQVSQPIVLAAVKQLAHAGLFKVQQRRRMRLAPGAAELARQLLTPSPRLSRRRRVAIMIPEMFRPLTKSPFYSILVGHLTAEAERRGLETALVWWSARDPRATADSFLRLGYDAAVCLGFRVEQTASLAFLYEARFPLTLFNLQIPGLKLPAVISDLYGAAQRIAAGLVKLGHRNICLVTHLMDAKEIVGSHAGAFHGLTSGWADYLEKQGLIETCALPFYMPWQLHKNLFDMAFRTILRSPERPTALVFAFNPWAKEFLLDGEFSRLTVPGELSLALLETPVGLPVVPWCPPLTHLEINYARTVQCLLETVQKTLDGDRCPAVIRVPLDLNLTESIGPPPDGVAP